MSTNAKLSAAMSHLIAFCASFGKARTEQGAASRELVLAAISGRDSFAEAVEALYERIRGNVEGLAETVGATPAKDAGRFTVPGSLMAQVSQVSRAVKFGVKLGTAAKPRGIGEIRKDTAKAAKDAADKEAAKEEKAALAKLSPEARKDAETRAGIVTALTEIANAIGSNPELSGKPLAEIHALLVDFVAEVSEILPKSEAAEASADDKGAAMAKAA